MNNLLNSRELFIGKQVRKISQSEFLIVGISGSVKKQKKRKNNTGICKKLQGDIGKHQIGSYTLCVFVLLEDLNFQKNDCHLGKSDP